MKDACLSLCRRAWNWFLPTSFLTWESSRLTARNRELALEHSHLTMARSSNLLVLAVLACATYMLLPSESFVAPQVLRGNAQQDAGAFAQAPTFQAEGRSVQVSMAATGGEPQRLPLVFIGLLAGTAAIGLLAVFFYGSYSGAGSGLWGPGFWYFRKYSFLWVPEPCKDPCGPLWQSLGAKTVCGCVAMHNWAFGFFLWFVCKLYGFEGNASHNVRGNMLVISWLYKLWMIRLMVYQTVTWD